MKKLPTLTFGVAREHLGRDGLWNPGKRGAAFKGGLQINVFGDRRGYLELSEFLRRFAEQDTSNDGDYHEHFEGLMSVGGNVRVHIILRKDDVGDSAWGDFFPKKKGNRTKPSSVRRCRAAREG